MIMMESLDESSYVYYEECSLYTDLSEVPTKQIINQ